MSSYIVVVMLTVMCALSDTTDHYGTPHPPVYYLHLLRATSLSPKSRTLFSHGSSSVVCGVCFLAWLLMLFGVHL